MKFHLYHISRIRIWLYGVALLLFMLPACRHQPASFVVRTDLGEMVFQLYHDTPNEVVTRLQEMNKLPADSATVSRVLQDGFIELGANVAPAIAPKASPPPLSGAFVYCDGHFAIVQGRRQTDASIDKWEALSGRKIAAENREKYKRNGGALPLEGRCRVLGFLKSGQAVTDRIAALPTDAQMRPLRRVHFQIAILNARQMQ